MACMTVQQWLGPASVTAVHAAVITGLMPNTSTPAICTADTA
jgi:hypothetical protein